MEDTVLSDAQGHTSYMLEHDQANSTFCANGRTRTANANGPARIVFNAGGSIIPRLMDPGACTTAPDQGVVHGDAGLVIETIRVSGPPIVEPRARYERVALLRLTPAVARAARIGAAPEARWA
jgi:hypothetical protein